LNRTARKVEFEEETTVGGYIPLISFGRTPLRILALLGILLFPGARVKAIPAPPAAPAITDLTELERVFQSPPEDSKIMMRWWWFGPAVTHAELEREMRLMKEAGVGGFEVQPVYPLTLDDPAKGWANLRYLSPEFLDAVRFTANVARQLGLRMDMTLGSGWPYGGPHISHSLAAGGLRVERVPVPWGTTQLPLPKVNAGERFIEAFVAQGSAKSFDGETVHEVTEVKNGELRLPPPPGGPRVVLYFIAGKTGMMVKRPAVGAEGFVLDHYRQAALDRHLAAVGEPLVEAAGPSSIRSMFCDSLEAYGSDWTLDLLEEFRRRRGYDLRPYLPALVGEAGSQTKAIRHDWGQTLSELFNENFLLPLEQWCHRHNVLLRAQAYGIPPAELSSYSFVDLPEGEQSDEGGRRWNNFTPARWASSAAHHYGRPVVSGETWTWIHSPVFRATPLDLKAGADEQFLEGITQLVGHGWPYSPQGAEMPGWFFYAAGALNENNPWWPVMPDLALYLQRVSFMLRQGRPANDIALYLPEHDAWAQFAAGHVNLWEKTWRRLGPTIIPRLLEAGYGFDMVDDDVITRLGHIEKGKLSVNDQRFSVIVLPGVERIPAATVGKLAEFVRQGGILIATRRLPNAAPGFLDAVQSTAKVAGLVKELFAGRSAPAHFIADESKALVPALRRLYPQDVTLSIPTPALGFIHRTSGLGEIYFIANTSSQRVSIAATFRAVGGKPEWWDPMTGEVSGAEVVKRPNGATTIPLDLEPYGSRLLLFAARETPQPQATWRVARSPAPLDLSRSWEVSFEGSGKQIQMEILRSWTDDPDTRFFSGRATYHKKVGVPAEFLQAKTQVRLNFGEPVVVAFDPRDQFRAWVDSPVREAAIVYVNGRRAGAVWHPPYELDVTAFLHDGENDLRVVVGNLAINQMAAQPRPDYKELTARYGERFSDQDLGKLQPVPAGLMGTVYLVAVEHSLSNH
jgi:hypothetical protein